MVAEATKGFRANVAAGILNKEVPSAATPSRLGRWLVRTGEDRVDLFAWGRDNAVEWQALDQRGKYDKAAADSRAQSEARAEKREIGEIPSPADPKLRADCDANLFTFATTCFPELFYLEHSPDHYTLAAAIQSTIESGGKRAIACQRGFGKTVWCTLGVMWAALTGRVPMIMLISGNDTEASNIAAGIVVELETNEHLNAVYSEICHAFRFISSLGPTARPLHNGEPIRLKKNPDVVFPALPGVVGAECCIRVCGIDSRRIRGAHHRTTTGKHVRPGVVLLDDPQDDDFAGRKKDVDKREKKIKKAVHGVAGPGRRVAVLMPCTVITKNDLADRFLDINRTPEYQGLRFPALDSFPDCFNEDTESTNLWDDYFEHLANDLLIGDEKHETATAFYLENREAMSAGASLRWEARIEGSAVDALQTLMNKYAEDRPSFMSEYQQAPEDEEESIGYLDEAEIAGRFNKLKTRVVPSDCNIATAAIDIQQRVLYWMVVAWSDDLRGYVTAYGTFPGQRTPQFTHLTAPYTFEDYSRKKFPLQRMKWEESLKLAIRDCVDVNIRPEIQRLGDGNATPLEVSNCHIDYAWNKSREAVEAVAGEPTYRDILQPDSGLPIGGSDVPISARAMPKGSRRPSPDVEWYFKRKTGSPDAVLHDANFYRSQFQQGLAAEPGTPGSITFAGTRPDERLADHFSAKFVDLSEGKKQTVEVWKNKVGRDQDHWFDCGVMNRVAVEVLGYRGSGKRRKNAKKKTEAKKLTPDRIAEARRRARRRA